MPTPDTQAPIAEASRRYVRSERALRRVFADSALVLPADRNDPIALRGTAYAVWCEFETPATVDAVSARLHARFDSPIEAIRHDVAILVDDLVRHDVLELA